MVASELPREEIEKQIDAIMPLAEMVGISRDGMIDRYTRSPNEALGIIAALEEEQKGLYKEAVVLKEYEDTHRINYFQPLPHQQEFLDHIRSGKKTVGMVGANQIGKCQTFHTLIETTNGLVEMGRLYEEGLPFNVFAWDGSKKVIAKASAPFKKPGVHECYRITMTNGAWCEPADLHRVLTSSGWRTVHQIYTSWNTLRQSNSDTCRSIHALNVPNYAGTGIGYRGHYSGYPHLCDERPRMGQDTGQVFSPSQAGVQLLGARWLHEDGLACKYTNIFRLVYDLQPNWDVLRRIEDRFFEWISRTFDNILLPFLPQSQLFPILSSVGVFEPRQGFSTHQFAPEKIPSASNSLAYTPPLSDGNNIESITLIDAKQEVYDFEVEKYHNYFAAGLIHHNTVVCVNVAGVFSDGCIAPWDNKELYPSDYARQNGGKGVIGRILCKDWEKAAKTVIVPKLHEWLKAETYETKKNNVGVESEWFFPKSKSSFTICTYNEDTKSQEGWTGDWVHADEPPPRDKYIANRRGLIARNGIFTMAMTAIDEPWILDELVLKPDRSCSFVSDVPITANVYLDEEAIRIFEKDLTEDEKVARISGGWMQLTGRIWKCFNPNVHVIDPFDIPPEWPVEFQIDFHLNKPHAISFNACDPYDRYFICDEIWENCSSEEIAYHVIKLRSSNEWRMKYGEIDALSKGDTAYIRNRYGKATDSFTTIKNILKEYGIRLGVGSKDEKSYIKAIETRLKGINGPNPTIYIFNTCKETIKQVQRWSYDENGVPKDDGHFPENIGRFSQTGLRWTSLEAEAPMDYAAILARVKQPLEGRL